jgi:hypothetical protein
VRTATSQTVSVATAAPSAQPSHEGSRYTEKLLALMHHLETEITPPELAVRDLWASLDAGDRARFTTEFPQFMDYLVGPVNEMAMATTDAQVPQDSIYLGMGGSGNRSWTSVAKKK